MNLFWRNSALTGVALFLETCAFYLLFRLISSLMHLPEAGLPFWLVLLALVWAFVLSLYFQTIRLSLNLRGIMGLLFSVLSILLLSNLNTNLGFFPVNKVIEGDLRTAFTIVFSWIFFVVLWWRGASLSHDDVTLDTMRGSFQWGLAVVFVAVLLHSLSPLDLVNGFLIFGFFAVGLAGLSLARFSSESGDSRAMPRDWILPIAIAVGLVLALGLIISGLGLGGLDDVTRAVLNLVGTVGGWILKPILLGLGFIAAGLVSLGNWLASYFGGGDLSGLQEAQRQLEEFHERLEEVEKSGPPKLLVWALKWGAFLLVSAVIGLLLYQIFRFRRYMRESGQVEEVRESLFSWQRAGQDLSGLISGWWDQILASATRQDRRQPDPENPREVYHRFLGMASIAGRPKEDWQTPREHQGTLDDRLPAQPSARVVDDFQSTYYGDYEIAPQEMDRLLADWGSIQEYVLEQQRREKETAEGEKSGPERS